MTDTSAAGSETDNSASSTRSSTVGTREGLYQQLVAQRHCGALFNVDKAGRSSTFVCFGGLQCKRSGHSSFPKEPGGHYYIMAKSTRNRLDGLEETKITEARRRKEVASQREANRVAMKVVAGENWTNDQERGDGHVSSEAESTPTKESPPEDEGSRKPAARTRAKARKENVEEETVTGENEAAPAKPVKRNPIPSNLRQQVRHMEERLDNSIKEVYFSEGDRPRGNKSSRDSQKKKTKKKAPKKSSRRPSQRHSKQTRVPESPPDSSDDSDTSSSSSSSDSDSDGSTGTDLDWDNGGVTWWYAVVFGKNNAYGVFSTRKKAKKLVKSGTKYQRFKSKEEGWDFVNKHLGKRNSTASPTPPGPPPAVTPQEEEVALPPIVLNGKDPSTKKEDEVFLLDMDVDGKTLMTKLAPPSLTPEMAREVSETALDVVALPGKIYSTDDRGDTADDIQNSLAELTTLRRQELHGETTRFDSKWSSANRTSLRAIKTLDDLQDHLRDVQTVGDTSMKRVVTKQRAILNRMPWTPTVIDIWSYGGYITVISRHTFRLYVSLLLHLLDVERDMTWKLAKQEVDFYVKKFTLIRSNSDTRLQALCRIYILLRDNHEADWRSSKLEYEKLAALHQKIQTFDVESLLCKKCNTTLHGLNGCPWSHLSNTGAKKAGRKALTAMAGGASLPELASEEESEEDARIPAKKKKRNRKKKRKDEAGENGEEIPASTGN